MRLWSLDPKYLDQRGLVALWRKALLAKAVLRKKTKGYRNHPQLDRFKKHPVPCPAISAYLDAVHAEAAARGYCFDRTKIGRVRPVPRIGVTRGQLAYEWRHLLKKLSVRSPALYRRWRSLRMPEGHPSFRVHPGKVAHWERTGAGRNKSAGGKITRRARR